MNSSTVERLNRLNRAFYSERAGEFDRARELPWQGWKRVVETIRPAAVRGRLAVLDAGCGNGRFATYLHECLGGFDYVGVDSSHELLESARSRVAPLKGVTCRLLAADLTHQLASAVVETHGFDLVVAFGLLHHVPSLRLRSEVLADLAGLTAAGGLLSVAFWQFAEYDRFRRRFVDWDSFNRDHPNDPVDLAEIEAGDFLLAWGGDREAVRYCHWSGPPEIETLIAASGAESHELYSGRGGDRFNTYALIRAGAR